MSLIAAEQSEYVETSVSANNQKTTFVRNGDGSENTLKKRMNFFLKKGENTLIYNNQRNQVIETVGKMKKIS